MTNARFDALRRLFTQVTGREPRGAEVSAPAVRAAMAKHTRAVKKRLDMDDLDPLRVPKVYVDFWKRFGGEKSLTNKVATLSPPDKIRTTLGALVFGAHLHSGQAFGIDHMYLDEPDPAVSWAEVDVIEDEIAGDDEDDDGDDPWQEFTGTLTEALIEIAADNLLGSLKHHAGFDGCKSARFRAVLATLEPVYGGDDAAVSAPTRPYFGRGVLLNYYPGSNDAAVGFDTAARANAFRKRHPGAE